MNNLRLKALAGAGCLTMALVGAAHAGGFARGSADTDILFDDGNFNMRAGVTYVSPRREFSKVAPQRTRRSSARPTPTTMSCRRPR